jgi:hypothetical protein
VVTAGGIHNYFWKARPQRPVVAATNGKNGAQGG